MKVMAKTKIVTTIYAKFVYEGNVALSTIDNEMFVMYDLGHIVQLDVRLRSLMKMLVFEMMMGNVDGVVEIIQKMPQLIEIQDITEIKGFIKRYIQYIKTIDIQVLSSLDAGDTNLPLH